MRQHPPHTALYRFYNEDSRLLYVGITGNLPQRLRQHHATKTWWREVATIKVQHFAERRIAAAAELAAIRTEAPIYNVAGVPHRSSQFHDRLYRNWDRLKWFDPVASQLEDFLAAIVRSEFVATEQTWCATWLWAGPDAFEGLVSSLFGWERMTDDGDPWLRSSDAYDAAVSFLYETCPDCSHPVDEMCWHWPRPDIGSYVRHLAPPTIRDRYMRWRDRFPPTLPEWIPSSEAKVKAAVR